MCARRAPRQEESGNASPRADERVQLPTLYAEWLAGPGAWLANRFTVDGAAVEETVTILFPTEGSRLVLDPDLPQNGAWLFPRADRADVQWSSPTLAPLQRGGRAGFALTPGRHTLTATRPGSAPQTINFEVQTRQPEAPSQSLFPSLKARQPARFKKDES